MAVPIFMPTRESMPLYVSQDVASARGKRDWMERALNIENWRCTQKLPAKHGKTRQDQMLN